MASNPDSTDGIRKRFEANAETFGASREVTVLVSAAVPGPSMGGTLPATGGPLGGAVQWRSPAERVYRPDQPAKFTPDLLRPKRQWSCRTFVILPQTCPALRWRGVADEQREQVSPSASFRTKARCRRSAQPEGFRTPAATHGENVRDGQRPKNLHKRRRPVRAQLSIVP